MMRASLRTHAQHIAQSTHAALFMHCMVGQVAEPGLRRAGAAEASAERRLLPSRSVSVYDCSLSFSLLGPAARSAKRGARGPWRVSREGHRFAYSDESVVPASAAASPLRLAEDLRHDRRQRHGGGKRIGGGLVDRIGCDRSDRLSIRIHLDPQVGEQPTHIDAIVDEKVAQGERDNSERGGGKQVCAAVLFEELTGLRHRALFFLTIAAAHTLLHCIEQPSFEAVFLRHGLERLRLFRFLGFLSSANGRRAAVQRKSLQPSGRRKGRATCEQRRQQQLSRGRHHHCKCAVSSPTL